jgi:sulfate transport system substrate-binding protein
MSTKSIFKHRKIRVRAVAVGALAAAAAALAAAAASAATKDGGHLALVAYSTPAPAYAQLTQAFEKTPAGAGVSFSQSFAASGTQSRAVAAGLPADVIALSLAPDVDALVKPGIVSPDWKKAPYRGMVTDSVVALAVRKGNPKHITGWADLIKPGVSVVTPNPFTSGGARWNVMAAYGAERKMGKTDAQAIAYLQQLYQHISVQDKSAATSMQTFLNGKGDVAITYESDAIAAQKNGAQLDYVIPKQTILIENPIAVDIKSSPANQALAKAFIGYLRSPAGQTIWAQQGYRPLLASIRHQFKFPNPPALFTIDNVGGWNKVQPRFFGAQNGIVTKIERGLGVSTG